MNSWQKIEGALLHLCKEKQEVVQLSSGELTNKGLHTHFVYINLNPECMDVHGLILYNSYITTFRAFPIRTFHLCVISFTFTETITRELPKKFYELRIQWNRWFLNITSLSPNQCLSRSCFLQQYNEEVVKILDGGLRKHEGLPLFSGPVSYVAPLPAWKEDHLFPRWPWCHVDSKYHRKNKRNCL